VAVRTERAFPLSPRGPGQVGLPGEGQATVGREEREWAGSVRPGGSLGTLPPLPPSWSPPGAGRRAGGGEEAVAARAQEGRADCAA
jgi:hypothetical protein